MAGPEKQADIPKEAPAAGAPEQHPDLSLVAQRGRAETVRPEDLLKITDEGTFRAAARELIAQAQSGKEVTFHVDTRVKMTGKDGQPTRETQASILYDELKQAYPDRAYVFSKPDLQPGDKGYTEIAAPKMTQDGVRVSSKENAMTTVKELKLADGSTLPAGSKMAVGTLYDGTVLRSADPNGKVWASTPDGKMVQVADASQRLNIPSDIMSSEPKTMGQIAKLGDHVIVRSDAKGTDPDGKPLLDAYMNGASEFEKNYKPGQSPDMYAARPKSTPHLLLQANMTIEADTEYGHATAHGTNQDYFMPNGFADAKEPTAKNYTGETDMRSAKEVMRIRQELAMTDPTQVEAGLSKLGSKAAEAGSIKFSDIFATAAAKPQDAAPVKVLDPRGAVALPNDAAAHSGEPEPVGRLRQAVQFAKFDEGTQRVALEETARLASLPREESARLINAAKDIDAKGKSEVVADNERAPGAKGLGRLLYLTPQALDAIASALGI